MRVDKSLYVADFTFKELFKLAVLPGIVASAKRIHYGIILMFHTFCGI